MQTASSEPRRIDSLQTVRALAFLAILTYHSGTSSLGAFGVSVFLILSGFLMVYSYHQKTLSCSIRDCLSFSVRKVRKLYPLHIVMLFVAFLVLLITKRITAQIGDTTLSTCGIVLRYLRFFLADVLLIQSWIPSASYYFSLNGVAWYLSVILFLYAVFPLILKRMQRRGFSVKGAVITAVSVYAAQIVSGLIAGNLTVPGVYSFSHWFTYIFPLFRLGDFVIGCCLGCLFLHRKNAPCLFAATLLELAAFAAAAVSAVVFSHRPYLIGSDFFRFTMLNTPGAVLLIWAFANGSGALSKLLTNRSVLFIGKISAYGFLIHQPVIGLMSYLLKDVWALNVNPWLLTILGLGATVGFALLYMQAERFVRNRQDRQKATAQ